MQIYGSSLGETFRRKGLVEVPEKDMPEYMLAAADFPLTVAICVPRTIKAGFVQVTAWMQ